MKAIIHIPVPKKKSTPLERKAQIIEFGYEDPVRWSVYDEKRKEAALKKAGNL